MRDRLAAMKWLRSIVGTQPELRLIALLLLGILVMLYFVLEELEWIRAEIPGYIEPCGYSGNPCEVEIVR